MCETQVDNVRNGDSHNACNDAGYHGNSKTYIRTHGATFLQSLFFLNYGHQTASSICVIFEKIGLT